MKAYANQPSQEQKTALQRREAWASVQKPVSFEDNRPETEALRMLRESANASPQSQNLASLKQSANQSVQRKIHPLQRTTKLNMAVEETDQDHHPNYKFDIGTGAAKTSKTIDLDPWITRKGLGYAQKNVEKSERKQLRKLINAWDVNKSIVDDLVTNYVGTKNDDSSIDFDETKHNFVGVDLAMHLMAMQENVARRVGDIPVNCNNIDLQINDRIEGVSTVRKIVGWTTLLKESREELKKALQSGKKSPSAMGEVDLVQKAVRRTADPVISDLMGKGILSDEMKLNTDTIRIGTKAYTASNAGGGLFNFGYGHLRFIIFLEWRICAEMMLNQSVK